MTFSFRCRVNRAQSFTILSEETRIDLLSPREGVSLSLQAADGEKRRTLKDALSWALVGEGYASEADVERDGERLRDVLQFALIKARLGVDFGGRGGGGVLTRAGEAHFAAALGTRVMNDTHGFDDLRVRTQPKSFQSRCGIPCGKASRRNSNACLLRVQLCRCRVTRKSALPPRFSVNHSSSDRRTLDSSC